MALPFKPTAPRPELETLLQKAVAHADAMPPHDFLSMRACQHISTTLAECIGDAAESKDPAKIDAAGSLLTRYEMALGGEYSRELGVHAAGLIALLTDKDRNAMRESIAQKRAILAATAPV